MIKYTTTASVFALSSTFRLPLRRVARFRQKEVKTGRLVKFEFQINKESYFSIYLMQYLGRTPWLYSQCSSSHTIHNSLLFYFFVVFICGFDPQPQRSPRQDLIGCPSRHNKYCLPYLEGVCSVSQVFPLAARAGHL